jgi:hypothetical protein
MDFVGFWWPAGNRSILGGMEFLRTVRQHLCGDEREQRPAKRLAVERPALEEVIARVEAVKGESWEEFKDRHGDSGRDWVMYLGAQSMRNEGEGAGRGGRAYGLWASGATRQGWNSRRRIGKN